MHRWPFAAALGLLLAALLWLGSRDATLDRPEAPDAPAPTDKAPATLHGRPATAPRTVPPPADDRAPQGAPPARDPVVAQLRILDAVRHELIPQAVLDPIWPMAGDVPEEGAPACSIMPAGPGVWSLQAPEGGEGATPLRVDVSAPGYEGRSVDVEPASGATLDVLLQPVGVLTGLVLDARLRPVDDARVGVGTCSATTGPRGDFRIDGVPLEKAFTVLVQSPRGVLRDPPRCILRLDKPADDVVLVLEGGQERVILVLDEEEHPIAGARVHVEALEKRVPPEVREGTTDPEGRLWVTGLEAARFRLIVEAADFEPSVDRSVELEPSAPTVVHLERRRDHGVRGRVIDDTGRPLRGAEVTLHRDVPGSKRCVTRADGRFAFPGLPAEPPPRLLAVSVPQEGVPLEVSKPGYAPLHVRVPLDADVAIRLDPVAALKGRVLDAEGEPFSAFSIGFRVTEEGSGTGEKRLHATPPPFGVFRKDRSGRFSANKLPACRGVLVISDPRNVHAPYRRSVSLQVGSTLDLGDITLGIGARILVERATSSGDVPDDALPVYVFGCEGERDGTVVASAWIPRTRAGILKHVPAGTWSVFLLTERWVSEVRRVSVREGGSLDLQIHLWRPSSLHVRVSGRGTDRWTCAISYEGPAGPDTIRYREASVVRGDDLSHVRGLSEDTEPLDHGAADFRRLPPGEYRVALREPDGHEAQTGTVVLAEGEHRIVTFD